MYTKSWISITEVNIKTIVYCLIVITISYFIAVAQTARNIRDPEVDFVNTSDSICAEFGIVKNEVVLRLDLDLDDSGKIVTFLTFRGTGSRGGANWTAYIPHDDGYTRIDNIQFREDFIRPGKVDQVNPDGGLLLFYPGKGRGILARYRFAADQAEYQEISHLDSNSQEDHRTFVRIFGRKLGEPMPDDFFKNPPHKEITVTEILARKRASEWRQDSGELTVTGEIPPKSPESSRTPNKIPEQKQIAPQTENPLLKSWRLVGFLIVMAIGIVLYIRKKYKVTL